MQRPKINQRFTFLDYLLLLINCGIVVSSFAYCFVSYSELPQIIPTHFSASGVADKFGDKASIWILPSISALLWVALWVLSLYPHWFNYLTEITEKNAKRQYLLASRLLRVLSVLVGFIFLFAVYETIVIAQQKVHSFGIAPLLVIGLSFLLLFVIYAVKSSKN